MIFETLYENKGWFFHPFALKKMQKFSYRWSKITHFSKIFPDPQQILELISKFSMEKFHSVRKWKIRAWKALTFFRSMIEKSRLFQ